jgi:hypothetical protein
MKISKIICLKTKCFPSKLKNLQEYSIFEMKIPELIIYLTNVCWSCRGIMGDIMQALLLLLDRLV